MATTEDFSKYVDKEYFLRGMVKYTSRDYESIMKDFWDTVPKLTELWSPAKGDLSELNRDEFWSPEANADPGVILGKWLASIADMLGVNLDWLANELFAPSVSQRKNAEKLFGLIGYELGWYTAARTEVTFRNNSSEPIRFDFGFNGANFCTLNAYTDITNQARVITYNILPLTNKYGAAETRSRRAVVTENINIFTDSDEVILQPGESVTRVAIEGELRSYSVSVADIIRNNFIINLPSQHIDTTAIWIKAKASKNADEFLTTQWRQCANAAEFITPEPRFAVTYDSYSNAQIQISNYLQQLENYADNYLTVYWIDCSGVIGCVGENVLTNYLQAKGRGPQDEASGDWIITNLSNTVELPHTHTVTGRSPETAKEAYYNSRNYINTWDSLVTLPDYTRFLNREPGVDCGTVIDCQKALEINLAIYRDKNLTYSQKAKMYITNQDFPEGDPAVDWTKFLDLNLELDANNAPNFTSNFKTYTAMCFAIHNDFLDSKWGPASSDVSRPTYKSKQLFMQYRPPIQFIQNVIRDYRPLQAMSVELMFGYVRVFPWFVVGQVYTKRPVSVDVGNNIVAKIKEDLAMYFAPANRKIGQKPTVMEVVRVVQNADSRIAYFDAGSLNNPVINWKDCDIECFNPISFARYQDPGSSATNIRISPDCLLQ